MKELKKIYAILAIVIIILITINLLDLIQEKNENSLRPTFNTSILIFWLIIGSLSSFPIIFCIFRYRKPMGGDRNQ
jgi:hypothetical protein